MNKHYFIMGCFDDENRPNTEIIFSSFSLGEVKEVKTLIEKYITLKQEENEEEAEQLRETLEDDFGVNTYDLDYADILSDIYHCAVLKEVC